MVSIYVEIVLVCAYLLTSCFVDESMGAVPYKILDLDKGQHCRKGQDYVCTDSSDCVSLEKNVKNDATYLDICTFDGLKPIVCCPPTTNVRPAAFEEDSNFNDAIVVEKCREYKKLQFLKKDYAFIAVVGGIRALSQEFPHMAIIGYGETTDDKYDWKCGGSLISERWVLTAAHCFKDGSGVKARWVRLGELDLTSDLDFTEHKDYGIDEHVVHPGYTGDEPYNDIALFRLDADVTFTTFARPICLNTKPSTGPISMTATGWGKTATDETPSDVLLKITLNHVPENICNKSYSLSGINSLKSGIRSDSMICAGSIRDGEDTCQGDSGGPLQIMNEDNPDTYTQYGITSFGSAFCGDKNKPGVYTRVSKYVPWIAGIVWPNN